jgi:hypothetical protein
VPRRDRSVTLVRERPQALDNLIQRGLFISDCRKDQRGHDINLYAALAPADLRWNSMLPSSTAPKRSVIRSNA